MHFSKYIVSNVYTICQHETLHSNTVSRHLRYAFGCLTNNQIASVYGAIQ